MTYIFASGLINSPTFLRDSQFYGSLFVNEGSRVERQTYCYRFDKQYWSVTPAFPSNIFVNQKYARYERTSVLGVLLTLL